MVISLKSLLDYFAENHEGIEILQAASFDQILGVKLLPIKNRILSPDYLYVTDNHHSTYLNSLDKELPIICFTRNPHDAKYNSNITVVRTEDDLADFLNALQECYQELQKQN